MLAQLSFEMAGLGLTSFLFMVGIWLRVENRLTTIEEKVTGLPCKTSNPSPCKLKHKGVA